MKFLAAALTALVFLSGCKRETAETPASPEAEVVGVSATEGAVAPPEAPAPEETSFVLAQEEETVRVGRTILTQTTTEVKDGQMVVFFQGQEMEGTSVMSEVQKQIIEGLEGNKLRYTIVEDRKSERLTMMGQEQNKPDEDGPLVGRSVIAGRAADGKWEVQLEDGEATEPMTRRLKRISDALNENLDAKIYGTTPRKVGDEWTAEGVNLMGMEGGSGIFVVKFDGIEDHQGQRCAKLSGSIDITGSPEGPEGGELSMRVAGTFSVLRSLEHRVDLRNRVEGKLTLEGTFEPQPGLSLDMEMTGTMVTEATSEVTAPGK